MTRRALVLTTAAAAATVAAVVVGLAVLHALTASYALERAQGRLAVVQQEGPVAEQAAEVLPRLLADLDEAVAALERWPVDVVAAVPVLGRSWAAERAVARTAREAVAGAGLLSQRLAAVRAGGGGLDLDELADLRSELRGPMRRAETANRDLQSTPLRFTPAVVSRPVREAQDALGPAVRALSQAERALGVASGLLGASGPRNVLVALQNNAEARGAGGYVASYAIGRAQAGALALGPLQDLITVADPPGSARTVPAPEEYTEDFAEVGGNSTMWRTWNMSPHVPDSALVGARVAGALLGREPDVVVLLDVPAMGALAALGGGGIALPDGTTVTADELTEALLVDAYAAAGADEAQQDRRRAQLQAAASAAVSRLLTGGAPSSAVARTIAQLTAERHLSVWSARPDEQAAIVELGAAGAVLPPDGGDLSHVSVNNVNGTKLDLYVERDVDVDVVVGERSARVVQTVRLTNRAPEGLVPYVAGFVRPGVVVDRVELSLPPALSDLAATVDGEPWPGELHVGGDRHRLLTRIELARGESTELEVRYTLPLVDGHYRLRVVPQPLVEDADLILSVHPAEGRRLGAVEGAALSAGAARASDLLTASREVSVTLQPQPVSRWQRLQRWWSASR